MLYKYGKCTRRLFGRFLFLSYFSFLYLGAFLIKQLFHSRLLAGYEIVIANSYPTRACGIIDKYIT